MEDQTRPRRVLVCALGGTIAMTRGDDQAGVVPTETAESLVAAVPGLASVADVEAVSFRQLPGAHLSLDDVVELAAFLSGSVRDGMDGVVVTQGTDTIEETAFALDLLWDADAPLVVTGAMRNPSLAGSDGPANLLAAVTVAADTAAREAGCVVVLGDEIHAARFVQKRHSQLPSAFQSPGAGPIGGLAEGRADVWATAHRVRLPATVPTPVPAVALLRSCIGDDGRLLGSVAAAGYRGLVIEAFGGGHVTPAVADLLGGLAQEMPVVLTSRTGAGRTLRTTYGFAGSETDLLARGLIPAGSLDGLKSRVLLSFLLAGGADRQAMVQAFDR